MIYGSVCSGIEAASAAWHPLGWKPAFFSEIEDFPRAVLQHHYPEVPLHGDFTTIEAGTYDPIDLLVGGTPCQSFSIAGLRGGLGDDRGNLALEYLRLADRLRPTWLAWENVPGVLSSNGGRDFGSILGGMVELGYGVAYRVLDAQYVRTLPFPWAVPQRRRRVFVVGYLGDWRRAAAVLFERESLQGHPPPRREAGKGVAPTLSARPSAGGGLGTDFDLGGGLVANSGDKAFTLTASAQNSLDAETETETLIATVSGEGNAHALRGEGFDASEDGTGRGTPIVAFGSKDHGADAMAGVSPTLRAGGHADSHQNAGVPPAIAFNSREDPEVTGNRAGPLGSSSPQAQAVAFAQNQRDELRTMDVAGALAAEPGMKQQTYLAQAFDMRGREGGAMPEGPHETANLRAASGGSSRSYVADQWSVRRLTPRECERLQGFEDDFTNIPWRGKDHAPDGRRYKALGNSMAVNVMRYLGDRIELVEKIAEK